MATNKHASIRYKALDRCFQNQGRMFFMNNLIEACEEALYDHEGKAISVSRRQVYNDIDFMESDAGFEADIERLKYGRKTYFRYTDPTFTIEKSPLGEAEKAMLRETILTLGQFQGSPTLMWLDDLQEKLDLNLRTERDSRKVIEFEQNQYLKGIEYLTPLYKAINEQYCVELEYQSFKSESAQAVTIHPYLLKQYNNRWFILSKTEGFHNWSVRALDRIASISSSGVEYEICDQEELDSYFDDVIGVTVDPEAAIEQVRIRLSESLLPYVLTKPLHESQVKIAKEDDIIELKVKVNYELISTLLSFGEGVEVLEPNSLRDTLNTKIAAMKNLYQL